MYKNCIRAAIVATIATTAPACGSSSVEQPPTTPAPTTQPQASQTSPVSEPESHPDAEASCVEAGGYWDNNSCAMVVEGPFVPPAAPV